MHPPSPHLVCPRAILFDLDGTLADTAPDLGAAANKLRKDRGMLTVPFSHLRPHASAGAQGLINAALGITSTDDVYPKLRDEFLRNYEDSIAYETTLFDGIEELLHELGQRKILWGIVTNKSEKLTNILVPKIGLAHAACVVSGDTTSYAKPHPAPLIEAARRLKVSATDCWYVGDDVRDITAGRSANMYVIAAGWGYCGLTEPTAWNADFIANSPHSLFDHFKTLF